MLFVETRPAAWIVHLVSLHWRKLAFPLAAANSFLSRGGTLCPLLLCAKISCGSSVCRSDACCHSLREFIYVSALLYLENAVGVKSPLALRVFLPPPSPPPPSILHIALSLSLEGGLQGSKPSDSAFAPILSWECWDRRLAAHIWLFLHEAKDETHMLRHARRAQRALLPTESPQSMGYFTNADCHLPRAAGSQPAL